MVHNPLFVMSLSGSVILLLYILTYPIAKRFFSLAWRYRVLKTAIAFYLIPFPKCFPWIRDKLLGIFPQLENIFTRPVNYLNTEYAVYNDGSSIYVSSEVKKMFIMIFCFAVLSFIIILLHLFRYWKVSKTCLTFSYVPVEPERQEVIQGIKSELKIKRNVKLFCSEYCKVPIAMGMFFPVVIIPPWNEEEIGRNLYKDVIKHELVHIKHNDLLIKFLGMLVIAIHWFNPFTYALYYEISNISEMYCDSVVLNGKGEKERKEYGEFLLGLAAKDQPACNEFVVGIMGGKSKTAFKRRILEMKSNRKNKTIVSAIMMALICMMGGITICAYDAPTNVTILDEDDYLGQEFDFEFTVGEADLEVEELPYDYFFVDKVGNIYELNEEADISNAICAHSLVSGKMTLHHKNSDGDCTVICDESQRCSLCGSVKKGEHINTTTYNKCPHL